MRFSIYFSMVLFCCALFVHAPQAQAEAQIELDSIAAVVRGKALTCYEVEMSMQGLRQQLQQTGMASMDEKQLYQRALDTQIMSKLQEHEARTLGIVVTDAEVDQAIAGIATRNKIDVAQLKEALKGQGVDFEVYRENFKKRMLNNKLIDIAVRGRIKISDESMHEYYRKYMQDPKPVREIQLAQIFLAVQNGASLQTLKQKQQEAALIRNKLIAGADFKHLVTLHSQASDASSGGDMGWFLPGGIAPLFAEVFSLPVSGYTHIIRSPAGFHIVKVMGERWHEPKLGKSHDEVHARHILLKIPSSADEATRAKIMNRAQNIAHNMQTADDEAFATRAKEVSQGPSKTRGGDLGWFKRGQMIPAFEDVAFAMQAGETSGVVKSKFGLHIIRVIGKRHVDPNSFTAREDQIKEVLINAEMQTQVPRWLATLKAKAVIKLQSCGELGAMAAKPSL